MRIVTACTVSYDKVSPLGASMTTVTGSGGIGTWQMLWMAGGATGKLLLVCGTFGGKCAGLIFVTSCAELLRDFIGLLKLDVLWLVRQMTQQTIGLLHRFFMRLVTIETCAKFSMFAVTAGAILPTVSTRQRSELFSNLGVAGHTNWRLWLEVFKFKN